MDMKIFIFSIFVILLYSCSSIEQSASGVANNAQGVFRSTIWMPPAEDTKIYKKEDPNDKQENNQQD